MRQPRVIVEVHNGLVEVVYVDQAVDIEIAVCDVEPNEATHVPESVPIIIDPERVERLWTR